MRWAASAFAICSCVGVGSSPYGASRPGQQPALEIVEIHRLERLIRRIRRAAAGAVPAVRLDDLGDHRGEPLVQVREVLVVGQHVQKRRAHRLDVLGRQALRWTSASSSSSSNDRLRAQRRGEPQVEHRVVGLAVVGAAQHRTGDALPQLLPVPEAEHRHHPARRRRFPTAPPKSPARAALRRTRPGGREFRAAPTAAAGGFGGRPSVQP